MELREQFETIVFGIIEVDIIQPYTLPKDEIFVSVYIDPRISSSRPAARKAKLDTVAQGNILHQMNPQNLRPGPLERPSTVLTAYGGSKLAELGKCTVICEFKVRSTDADQQMSIAH